MNIKIRFFGAEDCKYCKILKKDMDTMGIPYDFIDANSEQNNEICDKYNVDVLPHCQFYLEDSQDIIFEYPGYLELIKLLQMFETTFNNKNKKSDNKKSYFKLTEEKKCNGCNSNIK